MIPLLKDMNINKFVDVKLPTKRQIFARVGANAPGTHYSGDDGVSFGLKPTEQAEGLVQSAEAYESPKEDLSAEDEKA